VVKPIEAPYFIHEAFKNIGLLYLNCKMIALNF